MRAYPQAEASSAARLPDQVLHALLVEFSRTRLPYALADVERIARIHLSRGNVLVEPNDQHLCFVRNQNADAGARSRSAI